MKTRKAKIDLLKGIVSGSRSIKEIAFKVPDVWIGDNEGVKNCTTGELLSHDNFKRKKKSENIKVGMLIDWV